MLFVLMRIDTTCSPMDKSCFMKWSSWIFSCWLHEIFNQRNYFLTLTCLLNASYRRTRRPRFLYNLTSVNCFWLTQFLTSRDVVHRYLRVFGIWDRRDGMRIFPSWPRVSVDHEFDNERIWIVFIITDDGLIMNESQNSDKWCTHHFLRHLTFLRIFRSYSRYKHCFFFDVLLCKGCQKYYDWW